MPALPILLAQSITDVCGDTPSDACRWLWKETHNQFISEVLGRFVSPIVESILVIVIAWVAVRLVRRLIRRGVSEMKEEGNMRRLGALRTRAGFGVIEGERPISPRRAQRADALGAIARSATAVLVWSIALVTVLGAFGVELAPIIASAGIIGVAVGFGAQSLVKDFLSGIFMLVEDQYGVGDIIDAGDASGVVEGVGLRTTRIRDVTGTLWHVPNGQIERVGNMSQEWARALLDVGVSYDTDLDAASDLIKQVADTLSDEEDWADKFLAEPEIWGVQELGDSSISIRLVIKTRPGEQWGVSRELNRRLKRAFDDAEIEIPFPQRTVWLRTDVTGTKTPAIALAGSAPDGDEPIETVE